MAGTAPEVDVRYSDSGAENAELEADMTARCISYRSRGLYPTPNNVVTADPQAKDKLVFKSGVALLDLRLPGYEGSFAGARTPMTFLPS
jgi:hypothetical protein